MSLRKVHSAWHTHTLYGADLLCKVCSNNLLHKRLSVKINRCSLCNLDVNKHKWDGGCYCLELNADGYLEQERFPIVHFDRYSDFLLNRPSGGKSTESLSTYNLDAIDNDFVGWIYYDDLGQEHPSGERKKQKKKERQNDI